MNRPLAAKFGSPVAFEPEGPRPLTRAVDDPEEYPIDQLGPLRDPALAIQEYTRAPLAICAQAVLGAVAVAGQAHADVILPSRQTKPLSLLILSIAASGERKSAVDRLALRPIYEYEHYLHEAHKVDSEVYEADNAIWETKLAQAKNAIKSDKKKSGDNAYDGEADLRALGTGPERPLSPILVCSEPTFEGYCKLTAVGQPAMGIFSAEGGSFIGGHGMSADHRLKTAAGISSVWDGEPIKRVRAGDGATVLDGRRLSIHLMAQPDVAEQLMSDELLLNQGLLSRFLVVFPLSTAGTRYFSEPSEKAKADYARYCENLSNFIRAPLPLRTNTRNELQPNKLSLTPEASRIWIEFHDFIEEKLAFDGDYAAISGLANKAAEHAARIAGVLTLWNSRDATDIGPPMMRNAVVLIQHYLSEALRLRGMASTHRYLRLAQKVLNWIDEKWHEPAIYPAAIYNDCPIREVRDRRTALKIIGILVEHGWLMKVENPVRIAGSVRKEAWHIYGRTL